MTPGSYQFSSETITATIVAGLWKLPGEKIRIVGAVNIARSLQLNTYLEVCNNLPSAYVPSRVLS
jgi:hypothetical protein